MVVHPDGVPYWVGHSSVTSAHFGLTACSGLWLLTGVQVDCINLTAVLILDTSLGETTKVFALGQKTNQGFFLGIKFNVGKGLWLLQTKHFGLKQLNSHRRVRMVF